jgi:hypothetical protein
MTDCRTALVRRAGLALGLALSVAACGTRGNFGEVRPELVRPDIHDWMGADAAPTGSIPAVSNFQYTDEERLLRDLGYPLIEPPYDRKKWNSVLGEYGQRGYSRQNRLPRDAYAQRLLAQDFRSPAGRYQKLVEDIRNDIVRIQPFFTTATRVTDMDAKRRRALEFTNSPPVERDGALLRIQENANIIAWVELSLHDRAAAYRFALERMVVMTPSPMAVEAERALSVLEKTLAERGGGVSSPRAGYFPVSK